MKNAFFRFVSLLAFCSVFFAFVSCSDVSSQKDSASLSLSINPSAFKAISASRSVSSSSRAAESYYFPTDGEFSKENIVATYVTPAEFSYDSKTVNGNVILYLFSDNKFIIVSDVTIFSLSYISKGTYVKSGRGYKNAYITLTVTHEYDSKAKEWKELDPYSYQSLYIEDGSFKLENFFSADSEIEMPETLEFTLVEKDHEYQIAVSISGDYNKTDSKEISDSQSPVTFTFSNIDIGSTVSARIDVYELTSEEYLHIFTGTSDSLTITEGANSLPVKAKNMTSGDLVKNQVIYGNYYESEISESADGKSEKWSSYGFYAWKNGKYQIFEFGTEEFIISEGTWRADKTTKTLYLTECALRKSGATSSDKAEFISFPKESAGIDLSAVQGESYNGNESGSFSFTSANGMTFKFSVYGEFSLFDDSEESNSSEPNSTESATTTAEATANAGTNP